MFFDIQPLDKPALIEMTGATISYRELAEEMAKFVCDLQRDMAFCLCGNNIGSVLGYLSFLKAGVVPLLLDSHIDKELLQNLLDIYQPGYVYCPEDMTVDFAAYHPIKEISFSDYRLLRADSAPGIVLYEELALLLTTSGSTGSPKLVRQSYVNIQANAESIASYLELTADERPITTLPMNYTYGLSVINSHLLVGATILLTDVSVRMKSFWDFAKMEKATSFAGVPFTYEMLKKMRFFKMDLPCIRYMTQAGGKLQPELHQEFAVWCREHGKKFIVMYGQTEATARMAYLPAEKSIEKYGSLGKAIPGGDIQIVDEDGNCITDSNVVGEIVYKGPNVTLGYAECREDLAKPDERGGVLQTGDMAIKDDEGYFYIVGRKKRFLKILGNRVNLDEIDRMIKGKYEDLDCASTGTDNHMEIYITDEGKKEEIKRWISAKTRLSETTFSVLYIPEIPKNESGKILYKKLCWREENGKDY